MKQYQIYEGNMDRLKAKLTRIQNKCKAYGCEFTFNEVGEVYKDYTNPDTKVTSKLRYVLVEAEGIARVNGWRFVGSIEHTTKGNIISKAYDVEVPVKYHTTDSICEHCRTRRYRASTFIVMNEETGEFKQVGKSCLCDFTCGISAEGVAQYLSLFETLVEYEAPHAGSHFESYINVKEFLNVAAQTIKHFGYVKNTRFDEYGNGAEPTCSRVLTYYGVLNGCVDYSRDTYKRIKDDIDKFNITLDGEAAYVDSVLAWLGAQDSTSDYMHNLKTVGALEYSKYKNAGLLVSIFPVYNRELEYQEKKQAERVAASMSKHVGSVGDKVNFNIKEARCLTSWDTQFGTTFMYSFKDALGNVYIWKTSKALSEEVLNGNGWALTGTVKEHSEFNDTKQTVLTRCSISKCLKSTGKAPANTTDRKESSIADILEGLYND